ncbi:hypothetical protein EDF81_3304 [Enterobacter sp. BIGb0383]|uniref:hypothetical protein n=1 Tax=unclassified Enterobacter TaxID=2608935 RepID=UPI000F47EE26|nr:MULTISPECIES: hypothetical protein [unclassified Enterobacter]ROP58141.1 hypothetical protein EDF81_3304 [Enterobacter sp. BIGb0383]ROS00792.1 hypothetical protein EC848_4182 [Enterobacter sp. BIGb0359]
MILHPVSLEAMDNVAQKLADKKLARYLCETQAPILRCLPGDPDAVPNFVAIARKDAIAAGFEHGRKYSTHVLISFLLGPGWENDLPWEALQPVFDDTGMPLLTRLDMAVNRATLLRQQIDKNLPSMHMVFQHFLQTAAHSLSAEDIWPAFSQMAVLRGVQTPARLQRLFTTLEADALALLHLPPIARRKYSAYDLAGLRHMGRAVPLPTEGLHILNPQQLSGFIYHILLALSFGRFYRRNPLFTTLHRLLKQPPQQHNALLRQFLQGHQNTLREIDYDQ